MEKPLDSAAMGADSAMRITPRFLPTVQLRRPAKAAKSALYYHWMADELRYVGFVRPGLVSGISFTDLDDEATDFDGIPGLPSKIKGAAMGLVYKFVSLPTRATNYTRIPSSQEKAWRDLDRADFTARLAQINADLKEAKDEAKAELEREKVGVEFILGQLAVGGNAYLRTGYQMLETGTSGIYWGLAAPNVPVNLICDIVLERDRIFGFSLLRDAAPEEQARHRFIVGFGNGFSQYALVVGDDGNNTEFWHYRNMSAVARAKLLAQLETIEDFGRITVADRAQLLEWEVEERAMRAAAKKRERGEKEFTPSESARLELLKKMASDLKDSKHLTEAQNTQKEDLENQIFLAREPFKLQEESADLIGRRVDVSVQFLQSGYIVVRSGQTEFRYENKRVTGLEPPQFHFCLPGKSKLSLESDGGTWGFVLARPQWSDRGVVLSQSWNSAERLDPADFVAHMVASLDGEGEDEPDTWGYGCSASAELVELRAPAGIQPGAYQLKLTLESDGRYSPEVYSVALYRPASLVESEGISVWDSESTPNRNGAASRVLDALLQDDKRRSRLVNVVIADGNNAANLPSHCGGLACDVKLIDRENENSLVPLLRYGFVARQDNDRIGRLETESGFFAVALHGNETVLDVTGCENFLNRKMGALVPGDGMFPNDYIRQCCRDAEVPSTLWSRIPEGDAGFTRIAPTRPGRYPHLKPSQGTTFLTAIADCVSNHCKGAEFWNDGGGLRLDKFAVRDRPELAFGTPATGVSVNSHLCLRNQFKLSDDLGDYITSAAFIGAKDPKTGQRCAQTVSIPQAVDPAFEGSPYHIGYEIPYVSEPDDSLRDDAACARAARDHLKKTPQTPDGLAPKTADIEVDYDPTILTGDLPRIFGVKFLVDTLEFAALNSSSAGEDAGKIKIGVQLAEDVEVPSG